MSQGESGVSQGASASVLEHVLRSGLSENPHYPPPVVVSDLRQVAAIEAHSIKAWPPAFVELTDDGWVLRATPGLPGRGRSNHALPPVRAIDPSDYDDALDRVLAFAARHGVEGGLQVSPTDLHAPLIDALEQRGWSIGPDVLVMAGDTRTVAAGSGSVSVMGGSHSARVGDGRSGGECLDLVVEASATPDWIAAWTHCDRRPDVEDHLAHVFPRMAGFANFVHSGTRAVGISVEIDGIVGLFCIAVDPCLRHRGLGKALIRSMLAQHSAPLTYLQVFGHNAAGVALYRSLGFEEIYRYRHALAPVAR